MDRKVACFTIFFFGGGGGSGCLEASKTSFMILKNRFISLLLFSTQISPTDNAH